MSGNTIVVRPEPGNAQTIAAARKMGLDPVAIPLQEVVPMGWDMPAGGFDGLLAGSANVFRHGGKRLAELTHLPVHAVGERTAEAARDAGFPVGSVGSGGLQVVLDALPGDRTHRLLRLGGEERVKLDPPDHVTLTERVVYRLETRTVPQDKLAYLQEPACVLLHSAAAARHFRKECKRLGLDTSQFVIIALGGRIAEAAGDGWKSVESASTPDDAALLALACRICQ